MEAYVRKGGKAIITTGFFRETYDRGIREMTSVRLTGRHAAGSRYMIDFNDYDYASIRYDRGTEDVLFEVLDYKTNASWADVLMLSGENNFPVLTEDFYGRGRLLILNVLTYGAVWLAGRLAGPRWLGAAKLRIAANFLLILVCWGLFQLLLFGTATIWDRGGFRVPASEPAAAERN